MRTQSVSQNWFYPDINIQYINSEDFDQVWKLKQFMRDSPFLAVEEHEQWYSERRDT
jgi:hypothetical protein